MKFLFLILMISGLTVSCAKKAGVTSSKISVSVGNEVVITQANETPSKYEIILIGKSLKNNFKFVKTSVGTNLNLELPNDEWMIEAIAWEKTIPISPLSGKTFCGAVRANLTGVDSVLSFELSNDQCGKLYSSQVSSAANGYYFNKTKIYTCRNLNFQEGSLSDSKCERYLEIGLNNSGHANGIKVEIMDFDNFNSSGERASIVSGCSGDVSTSASDVKSFRYINNNNLNIPRSFYQLPSVKVKNYFDTTCSENLKPEETLVLNSKKFVLQGPDAFSVTTDDHLCQEANGKDAASFPVGSGDLHSPYVICSKDQFNLIGNNKDYVGRNYELASHIDFNFGTFNPVGDNSNPFSGNFDGNGYKIEKILSKGSSSPHGLFKVVKPLLNNKFIQNFNLEKSFFEGSRRVGAVVGYVIDSEKKLFIKNVNVHAGVKGSGSEVGGLIGYSDQSDLDVINTHVQGSVVSEGIGIGGLIGKIISTGTSSIRLEKNSFVGKVDGVEDGGGLVGAISAQGSPNEAVYIEENLIKLSLLRGVTIGSLVGLDNGNISKIKNNSIDAFFIKTDSNGSAGAIVGKVANSATVNPTVNYGNVAYVTGESNVSDYGESLTVSDSAFSNRVYIANKSSGSSWLVLKKLDMLSATNYPNAKYLSSVWKVENGKIPSLIHFNSKKEDLYLELCGLGDGSFLNPKIICSENDLSAMQTDKFYKLGTTIEVGNTFVAKPAGKYFLDGNFQKIILKDAYLFESLESTSRVVNLKIYREEVRDLAKVKPATLARVNRGLVSNVEIVSYKVSSTTSSSTDLSFGGLVYENYGVIEKSNVDLSVTLSSLQANKWHSFAPVVYKNMGIIREVKISGEVSIIPATHVQYSGVTYLNNGTIQEVSVSSEVEYKTDGSANKTTIFPFYNSNNDVNAGKIFDVEYVGSLSNQSTINDVIIINPNPIVMSRSYINLKLYSKISIDGQNVSASICKDGCNSNYKFFNDAPGFTVYDFSSPTPSEVSNLKDMNSWNILEEKHFSSDSSYKWSISEVHPHNGTNYFNKLQLIKPNFKYSDLGPGFK